MIKITRLVLISALFTGHVFAATFKPAKNLTSPGLNALSLEVKKIVYDKKLAAILFASGGNANKVLALSFARKLTESNLNTIKQLNIKYLGMYADDEMRITANEITSNLGKDVIDALFSQNQMDNFEEEDQLVLKKTYQNLLHALLIHTNKMTDKSLKFFEADHADEDGSWGVVNILDTKNNEILCIRLGYKGT